MLRNVLEKAQRASEVITHLRTDNARLQERVQELEQNVERFQRELSTGVQELEKIKASNVPTKTNGAMSEEEKNLLKEKINDLLARISQYV